MRSTTMPRASTSTTAGVTRKLSKTRVATFGAACRDCPLRAQCTTAKAGRNLKLCAGLAAAESLLLNDSPQVWMAVERRPSQACAESDVVENDRQALGNQLRAGLFDLFAALLGSHPA